ncbi:MAG: YdbH domain-containing protein [Sphingopyxis sp.]|uniref:YdbH domain-containing protein n=1 Tax=Sphingopyxis sp. TaxID=1908224 RepID=UPI002ABBE1E2|nr:YdbH domain-containing protein [Sphingopyxis sp.]MDZ3831379.1 YdbH domain-containing protein [Sphingopyxis sp.]
MNDELPPDPPYRKRRIKRRWIAGAAVAALAGGLWLARAPLADNFIRNEMAGRDVPARYTIQKIGLRTQRLTDIAIGDPKRPDMTARVVEVTLGYGFGGPYVAGIRADGVRLYGRFIDGRLSLGALDKFRDPTSTDPFALPDLRVVLNDARARVDTPWGAVAAVLNGGGNLRQDFIGKLALVAPRITAAGCQGDDISFYGALTVRDVKPRLVGPLRGLALNCAAGGVRAANPQVALDLALSEQLTQWNGEADASLLRLAAGPVVAERLSVLARFHGTTAETRLDINADMARLRGPDFTAAEVSVDTKGRVGTGAPQFGGRVAFRDARASDRLRGSIVEGARGAAGTPVGPLVSRAGSALARMLADVGGSADFALAGEGETARIDLVAPQLAATSGARFRGSEASRISYIFGLATPAVVASGRWSFGGGDMPSGSIDLDRRADGRLRGEARFDPYTADGARLALAPVRFSGDRSGMMRFQTRAELSGPLGDGRVERLAMPISGFLAPTGGFALDGGCRRVGADRIEVSGFRLARPAIDLCSRPGAPLIRFGGRGLGGYLRIPSLDLRGSSGDAPFSVASGGVGVDLASMRWTVADANIQLGGDDTPTRFTAATLGGGAVAGGMAGRLAGATARIGAVPLGMSEIEGKWHWTGGVLGLDGNLLLTDAEQDARFAPLVANGAQLRFADGVIDARASFAERRTGTRIVDAVIRHALGTGEGSADLHVEEIRFGDRFQPDQLTRLALGVVANVDGSVVGDGRIDWNEAGVTSRGTFATANMNLAAAFGPVTGLTSTLTFDDLLDLRSAPGQVAKLKEVNPGIPVIDGEIEYHLLGNNRIRVEGGSWPFAGGTLLLHPATLDFNASEPRRLSFDIVGVDAAVFLQRFGFDNINATGKFDGTLPVEFDGLGGRIVDGRIDSRDGGGTLAYVGELSNRNLGTIANFAFGALRSLKYDDLSIIMNGDLDGEMVTDIRFGGVGQGEGATRNFLTRQIAKLPLVFNVKIKAPFRQLVTSAKGFYDPTILIEQNLPTLLRVQEEQEAAQKGAFAPVQPPASEPVQ